MNVQLANSLNIISLIPLISAIFVCVLGVFVFLANRHSSLNRIFFAYTISLAIWFFGTYKMFFSCDNISKAFFWDRFIYAGVAFIPSISYHFSVVFVDSKKQRKFVFLGYLFSLLFLPFIKSSLFINGLFVYRWGCHTIAQPLHNGFLFLFFTGIIATFINIYYFKIKKSKSAAEKIQAQYVFISLLALSFGSIAFLPSYQIAVFPLAYLSGLFCAIILAYAVLRHHLFNIKVIATEIFTFAIWIFLLVRTLMAETWQDKIVDGSLLALVVFFGVLLIRSVIKEVKQREKLELITKELEAANERLRQLDEAKSEFLSIASHQLRTPMTSIKGILSMLLENFWGPLSSEQKKYLSQVYQSSERLLHLVEDLLNISRIEAGKMQFDFKAVDLDELVEEEVKEFEPQALDKKLYLRFNKPASAMPKVKADSLKIRQVIQNLIDNSIKYTEKGGSEISLEKQDGIVLFAIKDTGIGLPPGQHLFEKFQRGQKATNKYTEGIGLGLYLGDKIIKAHGGKIWAESKGDNMGSTFYFTLPIA